MPILNYTTKVGASLTVERLTRKLASAGCRDVTTHFRNGKPVGLDFGIDVQVKPEHGRRILRFQLPVNILGVKEAMSKDPGIPLRLKTLEQAERVAWSVAKLWCEAQLAIIEAGQAELAEVFLPYALDRNGQSLYFNLMQGNLPQLIQPR